MQVSAQPLDKMQNGDRLGFEDGNHYQLAGGIHHGNRDRFFVNVHGSVLCSIERVRRSIARSVQFQQRKVC